ncbi:MAG TPA: ferritin-like domain-containing protein, partial [Opitutus sp.]|nr:ferritin-like domain-containing protein [Opitutus sp.]
MESLENLNDLFIHELRDLYDAEKQLAQALPLMAQAANASELRDGFKTHLEETKEHARRLEQIFKGLGTSPEGKSCKAMAGLIAEAKETLDEDADPAVLDAALIVAAQKVEHYEIAGYGSVSTFARVLNYDDAAKLLKQTIAEEEMTDKKLTHLASRLNQKAET